MNATQTWRLGWIGACLAAAGCVHGYGACLFTQPVKHTLTGKVHFRTYPNVDGIDNVPILALDRTAYVYSPAQSFQCQAADELQLVGVSEFPENVVEGSHVSVQGKLFGAANERDHTRFLMNVITLLPDNQPHTQTEENAR
jgi:hypothetical protein